MAALTKIFNVAKNNNYKVTFSKNIFDINNRDDYDDFIQLVSLPDITLDSISLNYTNNMGYIPGNNINFGALTVQFIVDEDYKIYNKIYEWMLHLRSDRLNDNLDIKNFTYDYSCDVLVLLLNNNKHPLLRLKYENCFPTSMSSISLQTNTNIASNIILEVVFVFEKFSVESVQTDTVDLSLA